MELIKSTIAVLAIASSAVFALASHAETRSCKADASAESWPIYPPSYVTRNCAYCHNPSVQGFAVAPRLAGQHRDYIVQQLDRLRTKERNSPFSLKYMSHVTVDVKPENECELASYLSTLPPEAANNGDEALIAKGEDIFTHGVPDDNVPACMFCHGPDAQGAGQFPRLGGQSYYYLKRRLNQWREGYSTVAEHMPGIAANLTDDQVEAVTSYLSFVK